MIGIQKMYRESSFGHKYSFLPPESFHMTIMPMVHEPELKEWNDRCKLMFSLEETDEHFHKILEKYDLLKDLGNLKMRAVRTQGDICVYVVSQDE